MTRAIAYESARVQERKLRFALPKGSLEASTFDLMRRALYEVRGQDRTYRPLINDPEIELKVLRPQEIPVYVAEGLYDLGITGIDWIEETGANVKELMDLEYGPVRLVVAAPSREKYRDMDDLMERRLARGLDVKISTEYINLTRRYLKGKEVYRRYFGDQEPLVVTPWFRIGSNNRVIIFLSFGATEAKPPEEADAIVDNTATGLTLEQNNLSVLETIRHSTARLIASKKSLTDPWKREKILDIVALFRGVVDSQKRVHIFLNVHQDNLGELLSILPSLKSPTVNKLAREGWYAVNTVLDKSQLFNLMPRLRRLAQGLVIHEPQLLLSLEDMPSLDGE
ncbi:MAG: ATP phosphoribosyltransferase [Aigarchaeota archaeon]|nr:ATP phosphoribosyltransferase [Aigarchaeota archaeon]MDW8092183.1 ATP phosphoribosyltransferase [Nitrososphaerota archaeon]